MKFSVILLRKQATFYLRLGQLFAEICYVILQPKQAIGLTFVEDVYIFFSNIQ